MAPALETLPMLESLNISGNQLTQKHFQHLELYKLEHLGCFDVSHNPELMSQQSSSFTLWKILSSHQTLGPNASFIGLANIGLRPEHVKLQGRWRNSSADV